MSHIVCERVCRQVPGFGDYIVFRSGLIARVRVGRRSATMKWIKPHSQPPSGRQQVWLHSRGCKHARYVHAIVLEAFCRQRANGEVCRHLNGNPSDNRLGNLSWGSCKENSQDAIRHKTTCRGTKHWAAKIDEKLARHILDQLGAGGSITAIARECKVGLSIVKNIKYGAAWKWLQPVTASQTRPLAKGDHASGN